QQGRLQQRGHGTVHAAAEQFERGANEQEGNQPGGGKYAARPAQLAWIVMAQFAERRLACHFERDTRGFQLGGVDVVQAGLAGLLAKRGVDAEDRRLRHRVTGTLQANGFEQRAEMAEDAESRAAAATLDGGQDSRGLHWVRSWLSMARRIGQSPSSPLPGHCDIKRDKASRMRCNSPMRWSISSSRSLAAWYIAATSPRRLIVSSSPISPRLKPRCWARRMNCRRSSSSLPYFR